MSHPRSKVCCLALGGLREMGGDPLAERTSLQSSGLWLCVLFLLELGPREQEMEDGGLLTPREKQGRSSWTGAAPPRRSPGPGGRVRAYLNDRASQRKLLAFVISWANLLKSSPSNSGSTGSLKRGNEGNVRSFWWPDRT